MAAARVDFLRARRYVHREFSLSCPLTPRRHIAGFPFLLLLAFREPLDFRARNVAALQKFGHPDLAARDRLDQRPLTDAQHHRRTRNADQPAIRIACPHNERIFRRFGCASFSPPRPVGEKRRTTQSSVSLQLRPRRETGFDVANSISEISAKLQVGNALRARLGSHPRRGRIQVFGQRDRVDQRLFLGRNSRSPKPHSQSPREIGENARKAI